MRLMVTEKLSGSYRKEIPNQLQITSRELHNIWIVKCLQKAQIYTQAMLRF